MDNQHTDLVVKNLKKSFGENKVLRGINFELHEGERVVVLGPSGSGKSTFLRCINWMEEPTSGEIFLDGVRIDAKNVRKMRRNIGMVFQHFNLISNMTVMENLILAPVKLRVMKKDAAMKRARELLRHIGAIIRAMMLSPEVLLFDEPTSALDPEAIGDVLSLIRELADRGMTIMIVTHEMSFAKEIATRIVFIDKGRIIEEGTPKEFFEHPKTERVKEFLNRVL